MSFRIDLPLTQTADTGRQRHQGSPEQDFRRHLGLGSDETGTPVLTKNQTSRQQMAEPEQYLMLTAWVGAHSTQAVNQRHEATAIRQQELQEMATELYPFGRHAVAHLSYVAHVRYTTGEQQLVAGGDRPPIASSTAPGSHTAASEISPDGMMAPVTAMGFDIVEILPEQPTVEGQDTFVSALLQERLAAQWPMRRFQVLHKGDDIHVFIRDYRLEEQGETDLVASVLAQMALQGQQPERIFINGHTAWAAANQQK